MRPFSNRSVQALVGAELTSALGTQMTWLALPWFTLITTGSASKMALVLAAELLAIALTGVPSGAIVARLGARATMRAADGARAPLIALVPVLHQLDALAFGTLLLIVFALGALSAPHFASQRIVLPEILGEDEAALGQANSLVEGASRLATFAGPAAAGALIAAVGPIAVLWVDAGSYVASFLLLGTLPQSRRSVAGPAGGMLDGARFLLRDRLLQRLSVASFCYGLLFPMLLAALPFLAYVRYGRSVGVAGLLIASWGAGSILGAALAYRLAPRVRPLRLGAAAAVATATVLWPLTLDLPVGAVGLAVFLSGVAVPLLNAPYLTVITLHTPPLLRAKVMTALMAANMLAAPLGYLCAGPAMASVGVRWVFAGVACVATLCAALLLYVASAHVVELDVREPAVSAS